MFYFGLNLNNAHGTDILSPDLVKLMAKIFAPVFTILSLHFYKLSLITGILSLSHLYLRESDTNIF